MKKSSLFNMLCITCIGTCSYAGPPKSARMGLIKDAITKKPSPMLATHNLNQSGSLTVHHPVRLSASPLGRLALPILP